MTASGISKMGTGMTQPAPRYRRYSSEVRAGMLIEAGLACLARGGITAFTVDNICRESGSSRGLITHHFGSKDGLLSQVYAAAYRPMLENLVSSSGKTLQLGEMLDRMLSAETFTKESLNVWLALWGEIATNSVLQAEHRKHYSIYRSTVAAAISDLAATRGLDIDPEGLAISVISLVDGLWLEQCLDPDLLTPERARAACQRLLEPILGPLGDSATP
jgi:TetR/AcrR family transcriptional repressor of bet genes